MRVLFMSKCAIIFGQRFIHHYKKAQNCAMVIGMKSVDSIIKEVCEKHGREDLYSSYKDLYNLQLEFTSLENFIETIDSLLCIDLGYHTDVGFDEFTRLLEEVEALLEYDFKNTLELIDQIYTDHIQDLFDSQRARYESYLTLYLYVTKNEGYPNLSKALKSIQSKYHNLKFDEFKESDVSKDIINYYVENGFNIKIYNQTPDLETDRLIIKSETSMDNLVAAQTLYKATIRCHLYESDSLNFGVYLRGSGDYIGHIGLDKVKDCLYNIEYATKEGYQNKGYTTEAANRIVEASKNKEILCYKRITLSDIINANAKLEPEVCPLPLGTIQLEAALTNTKSNAIAKKLGFNFECVTTKNDKEYNHYTLNV